MYYYNGFVIPIHLKYRFNLTLKYVFSVNMAIVGLALGPVQHFFYKYMDFILPKRTLKSVAQKIFLDQIIASPGAICMFFYGLGLLEDGNFEKAHTEMKQKFFTIYLVRNV